MNILVGTTTWRKPGSPRLCFKDSFSTRRKHPFHTLHEQKAHFYCVKSLGLRGLYVTTLSLSYLNILCLSGSVLAPWCLDSFCLSLQMKNINIKKGNLADMAQGGQQGARSCPLPQMADPTGKGHFASPSCCFSYCTAHQEEERFPLSPAKAQPVKDCHNPANEKP